MRPALAPGKVVVGWRFKRPRVGDIVVAYHNSREIIKRVADISDSKYFLLGDNPEASTDSRAFGWLAKNQIKAVVVLVI
jgi:type IV secretory pathway protease TraF